jgi:outer membrane receptor protein involved in Fe transport
VCLLGAGASALVQQAAPTPAPPEQAPAVAPSAPAAPPPPNTLLDGTAVKLRLAENLTSATAKAGQQVSFEVTEEVDVQGVPVILKGAQALATVTDASPKKSMGRGGKLDVNVDSVRLVDGEKAQLRAV